MLLYNFLYLIFSVMMVGSAVAALASRNPVYSVLFLIYTFFNAAGIFILHGAEFIAMILVIVYVGAVVVLFLFVVMMMNINIAKVKPSFSRILPLALLIGMVLLADLYLAFNKSLLNDGEDFLSNPTIAIMSDQQTNTHAIGSVLYTDFATQFQISGVILLLAMVSSILLTLRRRDGVKRQNVAAQLARDPKKSIRLVRMKSGEGVGNV